MLSYRTCTYVLWIHPYMCTFKMKVIHKHTFDSDIHLKNIIHIII